MLNNISKEDSKYIAHITGNGCRNHSWRQMSVYGIEKIFGDNNDLVEFESSEEEEEFYHQRYLQYYDLRWIQKSTNLREQRKKCEKCHSSDNLQVHHLRYISGLKVWEYGDEHLQVLCDRCHAKEHGLLDPRSCHDRKIA